MKPLAAMVTQLPAATWPPEVYSEPDVEPLAENVPKLLATLGVALSHESAGSPRPRHQPAQPPALPPRATSLPPQASALPRPLAPRPLPGSISLHF
ncbi:unnamed protein product [Microthlaspi erraticum]|uniref:Uncharacterized protein n=1 Tax=Microthlaspi erraticum TaxID=1685480 RepID=A0A6D2K2R1_9BRAS|nr:unnamed protein product [Microthlaspi erraticum]CAA7056755.1 unnamed protein product [Microthlaspi erraticum]